MSILVHLQKFEGPLGLLLHLIRKNEMDIYDIEISKITQQYLEYINIMKELDLEVAGDFVSMAAMLINIKSKMLLPQYDKETGQPVEAEDPRKELVNRLLEYEQYQEATKWFKDRHVLGRDTWKRGLREIWSDGEDAIILDEGGLFAMIALYRKALKKAQKGVHVVMEKMQSLSSRIMELKDLLIPGKQVVLMDLIPVAELTKTKLVLTFMSVLELSRLGFTSVYQNEDCGPIHIHTKRNIEKDIVSQVQELEVQHQTAIDPVQTTKVTVVDVEPEVSASDAEIEALEQQLAMDLETPVAPSVEVAQAENDMLSDLAKKIEAIPEINEPMPIEEVVLTEADIEAAQDLMTMEMEAISEDPNPLREPEAFEEVKVVVEPPQESASDSELAPTDVKPDGEILT